jgi:RecA-family ATPase
MKFSDWFDLGYTSLTPVSPPGASVFSAGKAPANRTANGWRNRSGWNTIRVEREDTDAWEAWGGGLGLWNDGSYFILDIDVYDEETANQIEKYARKTLGDAPRRVGQWPKRALFYGADGNIPVLNLPFGEGKDKIETSSPGKHMVIQGVHPGTMRPYEWDRPIPRAEDLPKVTGNMALDFFEVLERKLPKAKMSFGSSKESEAKDPEALKGDPDLIRRAAANAPNPMSNGWDEYVAMGQAIRGAFGPGSEEEAFEVWDEWASRWEGGYNAEAVRRHWGTMRPSRSLGAQYVLERAGAEFVAERFFEPVEQDPLDDMFAGQLESEKPKRKLEILLRNDIEHMRPQKYMIERHIPQGGLGFLYGAPGAGKSFIALDMALHLAYGRDEWHGDKINDTEGWVIYLAREGSAGFKARIHAWEAHHALHDPDPHNCRFALIRETLNFMKPEDIVSLIDAVTDANLTPISMIVVDTVSRVIPGADENLQKDMTLFVQACEALQTRFGCAVMGVHHAGKSGAMRGSTVFTGAGDFIFTLAKDDKKPKDVLLTCAKQKDIEDGWTNAYALETVQLTGDSTSLVPRRKTDEEIKKAETTQEEQEDMLTALQQAWEAGSPWTTVAQAKDRHAPRMMHLKFGMKGNEAEAVVDLWLQQGVVEMASLPSNSRVRGLRRRHPAHNEAAGAGDEGGIFG